MAAAPRRGGGGLTTRAAVLALVVCVLAVSLAYPVREYLQQRASIAALEAKVAAQRQAVDAAKRQFDRWQDPAYVATQAKDRLNMVDPGARRFVVIERDQAPAKAAAGKSDRTQTRPWFGALWDSVEQADRTQR